MRDGLHWALRPQSPSGERWRCTQADGSAKSPRPGRGTRARERACQSWGRCRLGRPVACDSTMPPMTGPEHYQRAEQLLTEASELIRFRQQPGQAGPADLPVRPQDAEERRRLSKRPRPSGPEHRRSPGSCHARPGRRHRGRGPGPGQPGVGRCCRNQAQQRITPGEGTATRRPGSRRMAPDHKHNRSRCCSTSLAACAAGCHFHRGSAELALRHERPARPPRRSVVSGWERHPAQHTCAISGFGKHRTCSPLATTTWCPAYCSPSRATHPRPWGDGVETQHPAWQWLRLVRNLTSYHIDTMYF